MTVDSANEFGKLLSALREAKGYTKAQLAARAGLDPSSISRLESGDRAPEPRTVDLVATGLNLSPVERERLMAKAGFRTAAWDDPLMVDLVELLLDPTLPDPTREEIRTLLRVAVAHGERPPRL